MAKHEIEVALHWMGSRIGKVSYSMENRYGPNSYDCSSSIYSALKHAGNIPANVWTGTTASMLRDLPKYGWVELQPDRNGYFATERGDIALWSQSAVFDGGGDEHVGMFTDADNIINCRWGKGIVIDNHDSLFVASGMKALRIFRYVGAKRAVKFARPFVMEQRTMHNGIEQAKLAGIVERNFDWTDNGIPTALITKLDQYEGEIYRINGEWQVLQEYTDDLGFKYLKLNLGEFGEVWVWERALNNPIELKQKQAAEAPKVEAPKVPEPVETPAEAPVDNSTSNNPANTGEIAGNSPKIDKKTDVEVQKEEKNDMSQNVETPDSPEETTKGQAGVILTKEQEEKMEEMNKKIAARLEALAGDEEINKLKELIPKKVRLAMYLVGDALLVASASIAGYSIGLTQAGFAGGLVGALSALGAGIIASAKMTRSK